MEKILVQTLRISWHEASVRVQAAKKELGYTTALEEEEEEERARVL